MNKELDWIDHLKDEVLGFLNHQKSSIKKGTKPKVINPSFLELK